MNIDGLKAIAELNPATTSLLEYAVAYARAGFAVLPLHSASSGVCSCGAGQSCEHPGKHPRTKHGIHDATTDLDQVTKWFEKWHSANLGLALPPGIAVIDIDDEEAGVAALNAAGFDLPPSLTAVTGRGRHIYYSTDKPVTSRTGIVPGVDIRGAGGYIIVAPSRHASGKTYRFTRANAVVSAPDWLSGAGATTTASPVKRQIGYPAGCRDMNLFRDACSFRARRLSHEEAETLIVAAADACRPPFSRDAAREKVTRAYQFPAPLRPLTDSGNAERLIALCGEYIRYAPKLGWLFWGDNRWQRDEARHVLELTKDVARSIHIEAAQLDDADQRERTRKWAKQSESRAKRQAMLEMAEAESAGIVHASQLDRDPFLLNVANGTIDLRTGTLRNHDPADLITKIAGVSFDADATCPTFEAFLDRVMAGDRDVISFLQRFAGYSLTGDTSEHAMLILYGTGANGKTTFIETIADIAGDYATHANLETFTTDRKSSGVSNDLARLRGARLVFGTELNAGARLAEATVKQITGGDTISARFLFQEFFEFEPSFKLFMASNYKPHVGTDEGIWRRIRLVPFAVTIPPEERDTRLRERLSAERPGILNWMLAGLKMWIKSGLGTAASVADATAAYREEMDPLAGFFSECVAVDPAARVAAGEFYEAYVAFATLLGEEPLVKRKFARFMSARGVQRGRGPKARFYIGIRVKGSNREA